MHGARLVIAAEALLVRTHEFVEGVELVEEHVQVLEEVLQEFRRVSLHINVVDSLYRQPVSHLEGLQANVPGV